jgi:hypothetical protein
VLLSDRDILAEIDNGRIAMDPWEPAMLQPSSIDVRLDRFFRVFDNHKYPSIDPAADQSDLTREVATEGDEPFILHPGEFVLGSTYETITLPDDIASRVEGKSSLGRLGLLTHATAGFVDPGDQALPGHEDRAVLLLPADLGERAPLRLGEVRVALPGPARSDAVAELPELPPHVDLIPDPRPLSEVRIT